jgi:glutamyl-tRNA(Gln) amidotransferase subunit E
VLDFPDAPFGTLTAGDYEVLGFLSGLEVHQQLLTPTKLFCRCPAGRRVTQVDGRVLRHMRPTLSELGEYDGTALMEFKTRKEIVYLLERGTVCTYEMDDTPPFIIDEAAVAIALELAMLYDLSLVSELHVMRKQYLDGSIPTGFQRTAMVGLTGSIPFRVPELGVDRMLRIRQLSLEEDSCREVADVGHRITFRTDRLGTPLSEVVTEPDLLTPLELQAGARLIARVARTTGKVRRGPGAARQDVNVSVAGGRRVEIKGVHYHRHLPLLVHTEAFRQLNLLRIRAELQRRGVTPEMLPDPGRGLPWQTSSLVVDATAVLHSSTAAPLVAAAARGDAACVVRLPGFHGILEHRTQPGATFASEIADRVRVIACPAHTPFMTHSAAADDGLGRLAWGTLAQALGADTGADALVLLWGASDDVATAAREVLIRARDALHGVPAETRQARAGGATGFERILPGPDRMYPDTDTPPLPMADPLVDAIRLSLPERPWEREARYEAAGLDAAAAARLAHAPWAALFDTVAPEPGAVARALAAALEQRLPRHTRRARGPYAQPGAAQPAAAQPAAAQPAAAQPAAARIAVLVRAVERGELLRAALRPALDALLAEPDRAAAAVLAAYRPVRADDGQIIERVRAVAAAARQRQDQPADTTLRWARGEVMRGLRGRVAAGDVLQQLDAALDPARVEVA